MGPYRGKRIFDLVFVAVVALPALLIGLVCAIAVRLTSRGPVFFHQERVGRDGRLFDMPKFRTMIDAPEGNPIFPDDKRITGVGRILRRLSLDELPQLWSVARGDMSVVGPRPTLLYQVERYTPRQRRRLEVRPGLTGLAQVTGRNTITWTERIELDLEYIERQSVWLDLRLVARTGLAVVHARGVGGHPEDDPLSRPPQASSV